ncbi:MAG: peptidoglycan DD-metalloendopeptidase family protein [Candidatus Liptonbacteria bacterium]|nr:peptidoglycan DD-metalloendopeptidase family protein [Candidatus Liptonbacteria bacterium]
MPRTRPTFTLIAIACAIVLFGTLPPRVFGEETADNTAATSTLTREDLEQQIQSRANELQELQPKLEAAQKELRETRAEKTTLQRAVNTIQSNINQLNLSIRADQLTVEKLKLEIESLNYDIGDIASSTSSKTEAIGQVLNEIRRADEAGAGLLAMFLRHRSLADGVLEAQTLTNLQQQLTLDIANLRALHETYDAKLVQASEKRSNALYHQNNLQNKKLIVQDQKEEQESLLKETRNRESIYQKQLAELEALRQRIDDEVEALSAVLRTKIDPATLPAVMPGVLAFPVNLGREFLTQGYGHTDFAKVTYRSKWHNGIDIGGPLGTPILAAEDGEVVAVGNQDRYCPKAAYGKFIVVKHPNNLVTLYAHLSRQAVAKGDSVTRGQVIGYMGKTGWATGSHVHFTVFAAPTYYVGLTKSCGPMPYGGDLNPLGYLSQ